MNSSLRGRVISVTPVLDTNIYASGDYMGLVEIPNFADLPGSLGLLTSLAVVDAGKIAAAFDIHFFAARPTVTSALNAALDISAANANLAKYMGKLAVAAADYRALANISVVSYTGLSVACAPLSVEPTSKAARSVWAVLESRGAGTYAANGLVLNFGVRNS